MRIGTLILKLVYKLCISQAGTLYPIVNGSGCTSVSNEACQIGCQSLLDFYDWPLRDRILLVSVVIGISD